MIDWLLNILYNIGMAIGAIIVLIGVVFYFSTEAEYKNPNVANQRMLHELRKLNRLQREQIELERTAQTQAEMRALNITQPKLDALKPPGFFERMNMKMEAWNQRLDEQAAQKKQARLAKRQAKNKQPVPFSVQIPKTKIEENDDFGGELQQANVHYLEQKLEKQAKKQKRLYELEKQWSYLQLEAQLAELKRLMEEENIPADTTYTVMENEFNAEFWENYTAIKAEYMALGDVNMVAQMNAEQANYNAFKHELEAVLFPELTATQAPIASHSTPPPLPSMN